MSAEQAEQFRAALPADARVMPVHLFRQLNARQAEFPRGLVADLLTSLLVLLA